MKNFSRRTVEVRIRLLRTEDGGRTKPICSGYRPNHNFGDNENPNIQMGQIELLSMDELPPGMEGKARIEFVVRDASPFPLEKGTTWRLQEGAKLVGHATISTVLVDDTVR